MARGQRGSKSSTGSLAEKSGRPTEVIGLDRINPSLTSYEEKILHPSQGQRLEGWGAYAKNRVELAEALPYFQISQGSTYIEDDIVRGFLLHDDDDDGAYCARKGYMDAEIVIAKIPAALPWQNSVTGRVHSRTRKRARAGLVDQYTAFFNNLRDGHPLILILDRKWKDSIFHSDSSDDTLQTRYLVLDHFLVSNIWREPSQVPGSSNDAFFVRFERLDLDYPSWWVRPKIHPPPLAQRDYTPPPVEGCLQCGQKCAQIYTEDWFCCNAACVYFGHNQLGEEVTSRDLTYNSIFLKHRRPRNGLFSPTYDLKPDLLSLVAGQQKYGLSGQAGNRASSDLWKAIVCPNCYLCVPRIFWHAWRCDACKRLYAYGPTQEIYHKHSFTQEFGLSQNGHPRVEIICPEDYRIQPPLVRPTYRMDRVFLHGNAFITLISPTEEFNQVQHGPNDIFNQLLAQAPVGQIPLRRRRLYPYDKHSGKRTPYFAAMYGEQYDFSSLRSIAQDQTPDSVLNAEALLVNAAVGEVGQHYDQKFNQASLECYFDDMLLPWHTDGDNELGSTIAMLSLGSKAELRVRLKQHIYQNSNISKVIRGAYNWKNLTTVKTLVQSGLSVDGAWNQQPVYSGPLEAPEVVLPLIHGSIVIFQGKNFSKYFEHTVENADNDSGSLRFTVTARHIDAAKHAAVKEQNPYARQAGPKFSFIRDVKIHPDADDQSDDGEHDSDSDDSDDDDYHEYSTSGSFDPNWPGTLARPTKTSGAFSLPLDQDDAAIPAEDTTRRTRSGRSMRSYAHEYDSDNDDQDTADPVFHPKNPNRRPSGRARGTGRGRAGRSGTVSRDRSRSRSRSPVRSGGTARTLRTRNPTPAVPDPPQGLDPVATFNAGQLDPDNVLGTRRTPARTPGQHGGRAAGRRLHWWTPAEMETLRQAGLRVSKGQSTWSAERVNQPAGVTAKNYRERYWRHFKSEESPGT